MDFSLLFIRILTPSTRIGKAFLYPTELMGTQSRPDCGADEDWRLEGGALVLRRAQALPRAAPGVGAAVVGHAAVHRGSGKEFSAERANSR